eukprot:INCI7965.1.p1 GENE.INCI7965.1~~INCI7965.1.p1  ORF type:complete len:327 (-),score=46.86 INCI7965.1:77-1057(-)
MCAFKLRTSAKLFAGPALAFCAWQGNVIRDERVRDEESNKLTPQKQRFFVGSTDDMIMDSLSTGDVILFQRPWYKLRPFAAARSFLLTRSSSDEADRPAFDHCAVVVKRRQSSTPELLEWTDGGIKLTAFDKRLLMSCATSVWLRRLNDGGNEQRSSRASSKAEASQELDGQAMLSVLERRKLCRPIDDTTDTRNHPVDVGLDKSGDYASLNRASTLLGLVAWIIECAGNQSIASTRTCSDPAAEFAARVLMSAVDCPAAVSARNDGLPQNAPSKSSTTHVVSPETIALRDLSEHLLGVQALTLSADDQNDQCMISLGPAFAIRSR